MTSSAFGARIRLVPPLLWVVTTLAHCATDEVLDTKMPAEETPRDAPGFVDKSSGTRVTYQELSARHNPQLSRQNHTAYLGLRSRAFFAWPGWRDEFARDFFWSDDGIDLAPIDATTNWIRFVDHRGQQADFFSNCDGEPHTHTYRTQGDRGATRVVVDYLCLPAEFCELEEKCAAELAYHPAYCASAAR